jgi:hypothetical protein
MTSRIQRMNSTTITAVAVLLLLLLTNAAGLSVQRRTRGPSAPEQNKNKNKIFFLSEVQPDADTKAVQPQVFGAGLVQTLDDSRFTTPASHVRYRFGDQLEEQPNRRGWKAVLQNISNMASVLCVIDCTLLPIITIIFPLLNMAVNLEGLHQLGHLVAMRFVLPMGAVTTALNFSTHRRTRLLTISLLGLALIGLSNSHALPIMAPHWLHHGWGHRLTNVAGCTALLTSNYLSHQLVHKNCEC